MAFVLHLGVSITEDKDYMYTKPLLWKRNFDHTLYGEWVVREELSDD